MKILFLVVLWVSRFGFAGLSVGDKLPAFSLKGTDGRDHSLQEVLKEKEAVAVVFVATKCPVSNKYNERFNELAAALKKNGKVAFFPINSNDTEPMADVKSHASEHHFTFPVLKDEKHQVADLFKAERTPEVFLLNREQAVIYSGRIDDDQDGTNIKHRDLLAAVNEFTAGKPIAVKETKAFGCTIKRK